MDIIQYKLDFKSTPLFRDKTLSESVKKKLYICSEDKEELDIGLLHEKMKETGSGMIYHYVIKNNREWDGKIYYCRPVAYENELPYGKDIRNGIAVLVVGKYDSELTASQGDSLVDICSFLAEQESLSIEDIYQLSEVIKASPAMPSASWKILRDRIKANIEITNMYKNFVEESREDGVTYTGNDTYKFITDKNNRSISKIASAIGATEKSLLDINDIILEGKNKDNLPSGTVIYLPVTPLVKYIVTAAQQKMSSFAVSVRAAEELDVKILEHKNYIDSIKSSSPVDIYNFGTSYSSIKRSKGNIFYGVDREMKLPGYKKAEIIIKNSLTEESTSLTFLIAPSSFSESRSNSHQVNKTSAGWFSMRTGTNLHQLSLNGYLLDTSKNMERHQFIEKYKKYIEDSLNSDFSYSNKYTSIVSIEGREYNGFIQGINFSKSANMNFLYQYSISYVYFNDKYVFDPSNPTALPDEEDTSYSVIATPVEKTIGDAVYKILSEKSSRTDYIP